MSRDAYSSRYGYFIGSDDNKIIMTKTKKEAKKVDLKNIKQDYEEIIVMNLGDIIANNSYIKRLENVGTQNEINLVRGGIEFYDQVKLEMKKEIT